MKNMLKKITFINLDGHAHTMGSPRRTEAPKLGNTESYCSASVTNQTITQKSNKLRSAMRIIAVGITITLAITSPVIHADFFDPFFQAPFVVPDPFETMEFSLAAYQPLFGSASDNQSSNAQLKHIENEIQRIKEEAENLSRRHKHLLKLHKELLSESHNTPYAMPARMLTNISITPQERPDAIILIVHNITLPGNFSRLFIKGPNSLSLQANEGLISAQAVTDNANGPLLEYSVTSQQAETSRDIGRGYTFHKALKASSGASGAITISSPLLFEFATAVQIDKGVIITIPKG